MARVLPGLPEPLLQVGDLLPELLAVLGPVQLQKEVVALLQGLGSGGEGDDLVANPVSLQLIAADLIVQEDVYKRQPQIQEDFEDTWSKCRMVTRESIRKGSFSRWLWGVVLKPLAPLM